MRCESCARADPVLVCLLQLPEQYFPRVRMINAHLPADALEILQGALA
jgi:hypothetical protein